ncbi:MAG: hypothetical protein JSR77_09575 [Planctomycetes bacterium]|nr:hypothetical protein [Planctomycetota bacterium]
MIPAGATIRLDILTPASIDVQNLVLGSGARIVLRPGRTLTVTQDSDIRGSIDSLAGGSFVAASGSHLITGSSSSIPTFLAANGGLIRLSSTSYSMSPIRYGNFTIMSADTNSTVDVRELRTLDAGWNDFDGNTNATTVSASNGGVVNLSGVQSLTTPARFEDRIDFNMASGGIINLSGLQQISGTGTARFVVPDGATYGLNSLTTSANARIDAGNGSTVNLPALISSNGTLSVYTANGAVVNAPALTSADNSRAVSWYRSSDDYFLDLDYQARVSLGLDAHFNAPQLTSLNWVQIDQANGSVFNAPNLDTLNFSRLNIQPGRTLTTGAMHNIDNSTIMVSGGSTFGVSTGNLAAVSYSLGGYRYVRNSTVFSADGQGSVLDLSSVQTFNSGWNDRDGASWAGVVSASNGGVVNLSGVQSLMTPARSEDRIDFVAYSRGQIDLHGLRTVAGGGRARFSVSGGGVIRLGDLTTGNNVDFLVTDVDSAISVDRTLNLNAGSSINIAAGAELSIGKHLSFSITNEAAFQAATSIVRFTGAGTHFMEIAGLDAGPINPGNNGNFGLGHLILGGLGSPVTLQLLDVLDNGNRSANGNEALYLFGLGQAGNTDALTLLNGSTLYIDNLNVYARDNGQWVWLNSLFGPGQTVIAYDQGFLHLPTPGSSLVLALASGVLALPRRRGERRMSSGGRR